MRVHPGWARMHMAIYISVCPVAEKQVVVALIHPAVLGTQDVHNGKSGGGYEGTSD